MLNKYKELVEKLNRWNEEYYNGTPTVEDSVFDRTLRELKDMEEANPELITPDSPTQKVGTTTNVKFSKVSHNTPMLSLDNVFNEEDIERFTSKLNEGDVLIFQPKIDGISASLKYKDGKLYQAVTRGDGEIGEDITENVMQISNIPHTIDIKEEIEVRGEIYISFANFEKLEGFANPRNTVAGTMRQKDANVVKERKLSFVAYYLDGQNSKSEFDKLAVLGYAGFETPTFVYPKDTETASIMSAIKTIKSYTYHYEIDGVVIKVDKCERQEELGYTSKFPKWATAYKFPQEETETTIKRIFSTVGKTGKITWNAEVEPVHINGSTITYVSLHNANYVRDLNLCEGGKVGIIKAGEIIPQITRLIEAGGDSVQWVEDTKCPSCGSEVESFEGKVDKFCTNKTCKDKTKAQLAFFASNEAMNIIGLSESTIEKLIDNNLVDRADKIFDLTKEDLLKLDSFAEKSATNLIESINTAKTARLDKVINALGIGNIGKRASKEIAKEIDTLSELFDNAKIETIKNIGEVQKENIKEFTAVNKEFITGLESKLNITKLEKVAQKDITVVLTGSFDTMKRPELKEMLEGLGIKVGSSVSGKTDYLICGEKPSASKTNKIEKEKIITESEVAKIKIWAQNIG